MTNTQTEGNSRQLLRRGFALDEGSGTGFSGSSGGSALPHVSLAGASGLLWITGQFGQPTTLGFAVFGAGLALAALHPPESDEEHEEAAAVETAPSGLFTPFAGRMEW